MRHPYHGHRFEETVFLKLIIYIDTKNQVRVEPEPEYENENVTDILNFVPGTTAMNVPNTCTIVIIAGIKY